MAWDWHFDPAPPLAPAGFKDVNIVKSGSAVFKIEIWHIRKSYKHICISTQSGPPASSLSTPKLLMFGGKHGCVFHSQMVLWSTRKHQILVDRTTGYEWDIIIQYLPRSFLCKKFII